MKRLASEMLGEGVADPFAGPMTEGTTGVLFPFEEVAKKAVQVGDPKQKRRAAQAQPGKAVPLHLATDAEAAMARHVIESRMRLPPMVNDQALFTLAATYGNTHDPYYHPPSTRIASNLTPTASEAAAVLFEEFPMDPNKPRKASKQPLSEIRSMHASSRPVRPRSGPQPRALPGDTRAGPGLSREELLESTIRRLRGEDEGASQDGSRVNGDGPEGGEPRRSSGIGSEPSTASLASEGLPEVVRVRQMAQEGRPIEGILVPWGDGVDMDPRLTVLPVDTPVADVQTVADAVMRYYFYLEEGISERHIAPYRDEWAANALTLIPQTAPPGVSEEFYYEMVESSILEMHRDYLKSMRKAIVDYAIVSPVERQRLGLDALAKVWPEYSLWRNWWRRPCFRQLPGSWRVAVDQATHDLAWSLQTLSPNAIELSTIWQSHSGVADKVLVDVSSLGFRNQCPMRIEEFKAHQMGQCERIRNLLWTVWVPKCSEVFRRLPPLFINNDSEAYWRSIATLQSNQLRQLVEDSLSAFVGFLESHPAVPEVDPDATRLFWHQPAAFRVELVVSPDQSVDFSPSFEQVEEMCVDVLHHFTLAVQGLPRVEAGQGGNAGVVQVAPSKDQEIPTVQLGEQCVTRAVDRVRAIVRANTQAPHALARLFDDFMFLVPLDVRAHCEEFNKSEPSLDQYTDELERFQKAAAAIQATCMADVRTGLFEVSAAGFKQLLVDKANAVVRTLLEEIRRANAQSNQEICEAYEEMQRKLSSVSKTGEEVVALKKFYSKCQQDQDKLREDIEFNQERDEYLERFCFPVEEEDFVWSMKAYQWPKKMLEIMREAIARANAEEQRFQKDLKDVVEAFKKDVAALEAKVDEFETLGGVVSRAKHSARVVELMEKLREAQAKSEEINAQEKILGMITTSFQNIGAAISRLEPFLILWTTSHQFFESYNKWTNNHEITFGALDPEEIENEVLECTRKIDKLTKVFSGSAGGRLLEDPLNLALETKQKIENFRVHLPLIHAICNKGLKARHWAEMVGAVGIEIRPDEMRLGQLIKKLEECEVPDPVGRLVAISERASREFTIEKQLGKMKGDWEGLSLELAEYDRTGTYILKGGPVDEAQALLDDHIIKVQAMGTSPFAKPHMREIGPWESLLTRLQSILEEWLKCQGRWMYLQPIFGSEEIVRQIPTEGMAFRDMDAIWRGVMDRTVQDPLLTHVADMDGLLDSLTHANELLDVVEKGLNEFLETKKMAFPRFYFLSNDQLLEILSECKDPLKIQDFTQKIFEAVARFKFHANGDITGMVSVEEERIPWIEPVSPGKVGAVEAWLTKCEEVIYQTVHKMARDAIEDFPNKERSTWILQWPGQLVLNCGQVFWTKEVIEAIEAGGTRGLKEYSRVCTEELGKIVQLVRGQLKPLQRATVGALVVIDVHARDVVDEMASKGVDRLDDFNWESQLRSYWEHHERPPSKVAPTDTLVVRMINAVTLYGYEYLGNSSRLVITPLTDRCYRTLIGAIYMNLGGAPAGPAGTGKTETVKDLSKALAIKCVVTNCTDSLNYKAMAKFFKGLGCSGAWACFDEFNRIEPEVLSVVAQQVLTIQRAKAAMAPSFNLDGVDLPLVMTCNAFITMNPGYAGRSELPDNLKALFRDVAMMVPDYAMIAEILLYSYGYLDARAMARKLVQTYKLCSEQLSTQSHYDYGMRAVISVLRAAANLKRKYGDTLGEDVLMLRALSDVNLPKFLDQDVPLFKGIIKDLFPGVELPEIDYSALLDALRDNAIKRNLQPLPDFFTKIIQLYEMIIVRHGLMVVGESFGMKTESYRVLADALGDLAAQGLMGENRVQCFVMNPKAQPQRHLYGAEDPVSKDWADGVLAVYFRKAAKDKSPDRKWVVLDGPVDAVWIEDMNTVLDDNKKLCLSSGDQIAMNAQMNMIFEVDDLSQASPATVSRCGMVYMQASLLGWRPVMLSWLDTLPPAVTEAHREELTALFDWLLPPTLRAATRILRRPVPMSAINLARSCMRIIDAMLDEFRATPARIAELNANIQKVWIQSIFLFALVWSVGGCTDEKGRVTFDGILRHMLVNDPPADLKPYLGGPPVPITQLFPEGRLVYDLAFDKSKAKWVPWLDLAPEGSGKIPLDAEYSSIIVPTQDTIRYTFLLDALVRHGHHALLVGPTGTGKSIYVKGYLQKQLDPATHSYMFINFSAQTSELMTQDIIDGKLDRPRRSGQKGTKIYAPPNNKTMAIFIDDLNMPKPEKYKAQPPIELLRQWMDHGGWYDRRDTIEKHFKNIVNVQFVAAMGPPGGGRNAVTQRYLRHYAVLSLTEFDHETNVAIFSTLLDWWFSKHEYDQTFTKHSRPIIHATIDIFQTVQKELLPTPAKSHYLFNLRDMSRVFQGMTVAQRSVADPGMLVRLWLHETLRVFHDRLVDDDDRAWLLRTVEQATERHFKDKFARLVARPNVPGGDKMTIDDVRRNLFGDFVAPGGERRYTEFASMDALVAVCREYLNDHNAGSKKPMNLVLFPFAVEHVARIARVIKQPGGHALLVGLGGSGRQSLTRLAAFVEEFGVFQIELSRTYGVNEWHDDLRTVLRRAGEQAKPTVFLLSDTQIKDETFVEDISNLLNTYEVPNLFPGGDLAQVYENIKPRARAAGMEGNLYQFFLDEVRRNLHVVLSFSYVGDAFRNRLRMFPSLVNCCTINWFTRWPDDALATVAASNLASLRDAGVDGATVDALPAACMVFHSSMRTLTDRYLHEQRRHSYVTPTSYLELLSSYRDLLGRKQSEVSTVQRRYENGLKQLAQAEAEVEKLKEQIIEMQPQLDAAVTDTEAALLVIEKETAEADAVKRVVVEEEAVAKAEAQKVQAIKDDCQKDLDVAMPLVVAANKAVDGLTRNAITELKTFKSPADAVRKVMEAVVILFEEPVGKKKNDKTGKMELDYWGAGMRMMANPSFQQLCKTYNRDSISPAIIDKIRPFIEDEEFNEAFVTAKSQAAGNLCAWVCAIYSYHEAMLVVRPKQASLAQAEAELAVVMEKLSAKQAELRKVMADLEALQRAFEEKRENKVRLEHKVQTCKVQLERAKKLISGLGGEKARWTQRAQELSEQYQKLIGDVLLAAGQVAYLGPYTQTYRQEWLSRWIEELRSLNIPCSDHFRLTRVLGEPVKIQQWNIQGLPKDDFSAENAIALTMGRRWPLCIDPQGLANRWIRNMEESRQLVIIKLSDPNFLRTLENCIPYGTPVLLENIEESLDAALEPLLRKQVFKQAGAWTVKLGDQNVEFSEEFKFYITTKLRNPHFPPELCTAVSVLNFVTTAEGLADQLLGVVVAKERPDLEEEKSKLIVQGAENKRRLKEIEDEILRVLSSSSGNILNDEEAVNILQSSKVLADEISEKQKIADETEAKIDEARAGYQPVASHATTLYFCVTDMGNIDPMYQYSLAWFNALFVRAIAEAQPSDDLDRRLDHLSSYFTAILFTNVCRSLFEKDKLLFAFFLTCKIRAVDAAELRFLLTGGVAVGETQQPNPAPEWLSDKSWGEIVRLSDLPGPWEGLREHVETNALLWRVVYDSNEPHRVAFPGSWNAALTPFQKLLILRCLRLDKLIPGIIDYVMAELGKQFTDPVPFAIEPSFNDSSPTSPIIFVLSPGSDPMNALITFASERSARLETVSLGQGQGPVAQRWIQEGMKEGFWVCLQNCHLATRFLPTLELICEQQLVAGKVHRDFRLWLTSYPTPAFPISILENGVKITNEAPKGLSAGLLRTYMMHPVTDPEFFYGCKKDKEFRKMLWGLALFHSIIYERKKFGPIGWNIPYEFNENDLRISVRQLQVFLDEYPDIPYDTLKYTCGECNYGGKVTDSHDRTTLMTILDDYYTPRILDDAYKTSPSGIYCTLPNGKYEDYLSHIKSLPLVASPEAFGLHDNADISKDLKETNEMIDSLLLTQSRVAGAGAATLEEAVAGVSADILGRLPANFDIDYATMKYPQDYHNSMNTVLVQELERVNALLTVIRTSLHNLGKAVKGLAIMSSDLEEVARAMFNGKVPDMWLRSSFPSLKGLASYVRELNDRCDFFRKWVDEGPPTVFWISGFFFTQAFLTGAKQNYARKTRIAIDMIDFDFEVRDQDGQCEYPPTDGVYCRGLFIEGCKWDWKKHVLAESDPKALFTPMPVIWMQPMETSAFKHAPHYLAPMYKTAERRGVLSTTGHSTNFVMDVKLPSEHHSSHWIKRGVALLTQLSE